MFKLLLLTLTIGGFVFTSSWENAPKFVNISDQNNKVVFRYEAVINTFPSAIVDEEDESSIYFDNSFKFVTFLRHCIMESGEFWK